MVTLLALTAGFVASSPAVADDSRGCGGFPEVIALPNGFRPEGIAIGRGTSFYVGSLVDGAIYRGDVKTGVGAVLVPGVIGQAATGLKVDKHNRLFVSGAGTGFGRVYDAGSGVELASYQFADPGTSFINDVIVTRDAAYFTDSLNPVLYVLPIKHNGTLGEPRTLSLGGDIHFVDGFNANGIEASPDGRTLLVIQTNTGLLFAVDTSTGIAKQVDLGGVSLLNGDGVLRRGSTLYVVQNQDNKITVIKLQSSFKSGRVIDTLTNKNFQVPTTIGAFGRSLYAVNARFGTPADANTEYTVVRVPVFSRR
jgi:sugar lactone lactonase YvrE